MGKRVRINNDIQIEWTVNVQNSEGEYILDLSSLPLGVDLIVGTKVIHVEDFTVSGNIITFVFAGSQQTYTGSYVIKLYDTENSAITYDVVRAFVLVDHSWKAPDIISSPTVVTLSSTVNVYRIVTVKGEKGDGADGITAATAEKLGGIKLGYEQNGNNYPVMLDSEDRAYVTVEGGGGSGGSGGGSGGGGGTVIPRSVTSIDQWFKLSNEATGITAPALSIANPVDAGWNLVPGNPSEENRFLWCFFQINYDKPTAQGYSYTRTNAYIARRFNSDSSQEFDELERLIDQLREELEDDIDDAEGEIGDINDALQELRTTLQNSIQTQLNGLDDRITQIEQTGTTPITGDGLWGMMTSYVDDGTETGRKQKSFSDIVLKADEAKATLETGSRFFDRQVVAGLTLDGIAGEIAARVTRQYVEDNFADQNYVANAIASAQLSVAPEAVLSAVSKGALCWEKDGVLYQYDLHFNDQAQSFSSFSDYETFMMTAPTAQDPYTGPGVPPPFTRKVIVTEFSAIKQTAEQIAASVYKTIYMWLYTNGVLYAYDDDTLEALYDDYVEHGGTYTYDQYITSLGYTKVEVSNILTNLTQKQDEIALRVADMNYMWRKPLSGGSYDYRRYYVPSDKTRDQYVSEMQAQGWSLYDYTSKMAVIDQTADGITMAASKGSLCWVNESISPENDAYCRDYDYWYTEWQNRSPVYSYETWVPMTYSGYQLKKVNSAFSQLKLTASSLSSTISNTESNLTSIINQTSDQLSFGVESSRHLWYNATTGDKQDYDFLKSAYDSAHPSISYDQWVPLQPQGTGYVKTPVSLSGLTVKTDKIWAGVEKDGDLAASITILAECETDPQGSKIILDADNVEINGNCIISGTLEASALKVSAIAEIATLVAGDIFANTATLSSYIGVTDANNNLLGVLNGSDSGIDQTHGKLIFAAGVPAPDVQYPNPNVFVNGLFRVYCDGYMVAHHGEIGGLLFGSSGMYYTVGGVTRMSFNHYSLDFSSVSASDAKSFNVSVNGSTGPVVSIWSEYGAGISVETALNTGGNSTSISCASGMFAGLRPAIRSVSSGVTLTDLDNVVSCASGSITLPASPKYGQMYMIYHTSDSILTVSGNGHSIYSMVSSGSAPQTSAFITNAVPSVYMLNYTGSYWLATMIRYN